MRQGRLSADDRQVSTRNVIFPVLQLLAVRPVDHTVLVGVGDDLRGDDAVGMWIVRQLNGRVPWPVIEASTAPENFIGPAARLEPRAMILIDAINVSMPAGTVWCGHGDDLLETTPGTHCPSLSLFVRAVADRCQSKEPPKFLLVGIAAGHSSFGADLSPPVRQAASEVVEALTAVGETLRQGGNSVE